jgi:hypothetical protein
MVKINITIEDLEITTEQLLALLGEEVKHPQQPAPEPVVDVKKAEKATPKRKCTQCGTKITSSWRKVMASDGPWCNKCTQAEYRAAKKPKKPVKPVKPSYPGLTDNEVLNAVVSVLVSRTKDITTAHLIADQIVKIADGKYADDEKMTGLKETILDRVSQGIKQVGNALGMTECMIVDVDVDGRNGAQIAMFPAKEYSVKELLKLASK